MEKYAVTGGVPKYIESFAECDDIYEGIQENVLNQSSYLYEEPYFLLQQEVSEVPITETNPEKSKKGLYKITDNYIRFWFTFVYPNQSDLEQGNQEFVIEKIRKSFIRSHVSFIYEDVCREMIGKCDWLPCHFSKIGHYWDKNTKIDAVALSEEENTILFGECKYQANSIDIDIFCLYCFL